jgi:hypothetical protein
VFLACKIQDNARWRQEIYESAAKVSTLPWVCTEKQKKLKIKQNLFLGLEVSACYPYEDIDKAIEKISSKYKNRKLTIILLNISVLLYNRLKKFNMTNSDTDISLVYLEE